MSKPQPQTFAERLRGTMSWMLFGFGVVCTALAVSAMLIAWLGGWAPGTEHQRLSIIGWTLLGALAGMLAVIASLAIGGPVGRFKGKLSRTGAEMEAEGDPEPAPPVTVTTTTSVKPASIGTGDPS